MRTLIAHVYKEYRSHRAGLWVLLALVPVVGAALCFVSDFVLYKAGARGADAAPAGPFYQGFIHFTLITVVVLFAPAVVASEPTRGAHSFSFRLPRGPSLAFWSKLVFLAALLATFGVLAHLVANACIVAAGGFWVPLEYVAESVGPWAGMAYAPSALCMVAIACWLPRGAFALPALALLVPLFLLPSFIVVGTDLALMCGVALVPGAVLVYSAFSLLVAWVSFVRARRFGGGPGRSALHGATVTLVGSMALAAWVAHEVEKASAIDSARPLHMSDAYLDPTGRYVYADARQGGPTLGVVIDVRTGAVERIGAIGAELMADEHFTSRPSLLAQARSRVFSRATDLAHFTEQIAFIDTAERRIVRRIPARLLAEFPNPFLLGPEHTTERPPTSLRTPDGRRVWVFRDRVEIEDGSGYQRLPWEPYDQAFRQFGYGFGVIGRAGYQVYDLTRRKRFPWPGAVDDRSGLALTRNACWVLRDKWLIAQGGDVRGQKWWHGWRLRDPASQTEAPALGMNDGDSVITMLDDERVLVVAPEAPNDELWLVDPSSGSRIHLEARGLAPLGPHGRIYIYIEDPNLPEHTGDGRRVFRCSDQKGNAALTSYVPGRTALTTPIAADRFIGGEDGARVLVIHEGQLERVDLDTGERTAVVHD